MGDGRAPSHLRTRFGTVPLTRRQDRCTACRRLFRPLGTVVAGAGAGRATHGLVELVWLAAASWPWATAATILRRFGGAAVSPVWVRLGAHAQGLAHSPQAQDAA